MKKEYYTDINNLCNDMLELGNKKLPKCKPKLVKNYCSYCKCDTYSSPSYYDGWNRCHICDGC